MYQKHLGDVTCTEDFMNGGELVRFVRREVRRERTLLRTTTAEELTSGAWSHRVQRCPRRHRHMSPDTHHGMIRRRFEGWIFLYLLNDLVVLSKSFPVVSNHFHHHRFDLLIKKIVNRCIYVDLTLPFSGHSRMLFISFFF